MFVTTKLDCDNDSDRIKISDIVILMLNPFSSL